MPTDFSTLLITFAATGRIGPLSVGMSRADLDGALRQLGLPPDDAGRYESLDLALDDDRLVLLGVDHDGSLEFVLPPGLLSGTDEGSHESSHEGSTESSHDGSDQDSDQGSNKGSDEDSDEGLEGDRSASSFSRLVVTTLLDQAGCAWAEDPALTFAGQQSAIRTSAGVSLVFARPSAFDLGLAHDDELLASAYLSAQGPAAE